MTLQSPPVRRSDRAYIYLRNAILNQELNLGYPISEMDFSESLQMSRTPVREAIHRLIAEGLLERVHGHGTFVKSLSKDEIRSAYEYAEGLEGMVAFLVAEDYRPEIGARLMESVQRMDAVIAQWDGDTASGDPWAMADAQFHESLYEFCPNSVIVDALQKVHSQVQLVRLTITSRLLDRGRSNEDHRETVEAIMAGDKYRAREITQRHWERIRSDVAHLTG